MSIKELYQQQGYIVLESMIEPAVMKELDKEIDRLIADFPAICTFEDWQKGNQRRILHKISHFIEISPLFSVIASNTNITSLATQLLGGNSFLCTDKINFKLPGARGFYPHQDMSGTWSSYVDNMINVFVAIDEADDENGCLYVAPGRHREGLLGPKMKPMLPEHLVTMDFVPIYQKPGDILMFDGFLPHKSAPNNSNKPRRVLLLTFTVDEKLRTEFFSGIILD
jgi:ectoine hydroxylase-related dioxygenase (phytanoyl-CoA dioxygenase family)